MKKKVDALVYYGLHFQSGVAEYRPKGKEMYRILVPADVCKKMDPTFAGRPVYVGHVDEIDLNNCDGYVVESFFNKCDGFHWCKFLVDTEDGQRAIKSGMKLSNAYQPDSLGSGGTYQGVDYKGEVTSAHYDHLALVPDPRYAQSIVLTPDEFKLYNANLEKELETLKNSKESENKKEKKSMFNFFKREKVENSEGLENMSVELPNTGKTVLLSDLIKNADKMAKDCYANGDHKVKMGDSEMTVNEMIKGYKKMNEEAKDKEEGEPEDKEEENEEESEAKEKKNKKKNGDKPEDHELEGKEVAKNKKKNKDGEAEEKEKQKNALEEYEKLKNARERDSDENEGDFMTINEQVKLGRSRYGA